MPLGHGHATPLTRAWHSQSLGNCEDARARARAYADVKGGTGGWRMRAPPCRTPCGTVTATRSTPSSAEGLSMTMSPKLGDCESTGRCDDEACRGEACTGVHRRQRRAEVTV